ncbi:MAG: hypothetical protein CL599_16935 [Alteromonas sp.]|nr:hypothetical protein [Alteromonas sp.]
MARKRRKKKPKKKLWSRKSDYACLDGSIVSMDSSWEVACAKRLDELGVKWTRDTSLKLQYRTEKLRLRNYIPDFYLPEYDIYLEVKGYWTEAAKWKMKDIMVRYPNKIRLLESLEDIQDLTVPVKCTPYDPKKTVIGKK